MSFSRVIVAFDGSPRSEDALALALRLCAPDAVLTLACVVTGHRWHAGPQAHRPDAAVPDEIGFMFAARSRKRIPAGIHVRERAPVAPSPARGLTELAESEGADLIVIGSSAHGEDGRIRLERTAGRLLQGAPCAVAIAPGGLRERGAFRHVGVAYDDSPEARGALEIAYGLAAASSSAVTLLQALPLFEPDAAEALVAAAERAPAGVNPRTMLLRGAAGDVIPDACDGIVDLLVTGSRSYGPMQRALLGSVSEALTEGATHAVLVVPRGAERPVVAEPMEIR